MTRMVSLFLLANAIAVGGGTVAFALDLLYDFEGDSGNTITDKLLNDGAQNGMIFNNMTGKLELLAGVNGTYVGP